jgi:hypothetical protein
MKRNKLVEGRCQACTFVSERLPSSRWDELSTIMWRDHNEHSNGHWIILWVDNEETE